MKTFKIVAGLSGLSPDGFFQQEKKRTKSRSRLLVRPHFFSNRVVNICSRQTGGLVTMVLSGP